MHCCVCAVTDTKKLLVLGLQYINEDSHTVNSMHLLDRTAAVGSLTVTLEESTNTLWSSAGQPFVVDATFPDSILGYCVDVIESMGSLGLSSDCSIGSNVTVFRYPSFAPGNNCLVYTFKVKAANPAGNGAISEVSHIDATAMSQ